MHIRQKKFLFSLKKQFLCIIVFCLACISAITALTCVAYIRLHTSVLQKNMELYSSQLSASVSEMYATCRNIAYTLSYNQILQNFLSAREPSEKYESYNLAYNQLTSMMELSSYIKDIAVLNDSGNAVAVYGAYETYSSLLDDEALSKSSLYSLGRASVERTDCQILGMPVYQLGSADTRRIGTLFLAVDIDAFFAESPAADVDYIPGYVLADSSGRIIYGDCSYYAAAADAGEDGEIRISSASYLVNRCSLPIVDSTFYMLISKDIFSASGNRIAALQLGCMGVLLLIVTLVMFQIYRPLIRSLQKLTGFMRDISSGKQKSYRDGIQIDQGLFGSTEIQEITASFNEMLLHTYELNHTIFENYTHMYEMDINNKKTEIAYLRSQINPHFLYNTLTMICGMASAGMRREIIDTTGALSSIFRYSIKGNEMVPLSEELAIVKSYLKIQTYRFEDRFTVNWQLDDQYLKCLIPKMVIQPIVENAIVHGLEPSLSPGRLVIGAGRNPEKGYLAVWIFDTGIGMEPEKLEQMRRALLVPVHASADTIMDSYRDMDVKHHDSIGLLNVNSRMILYFGAEYSLILDSEKGVGTNVQLRIPYRTADAAQNIGDSNDVQSNSD